MEIRALRPSDDRSHFRSGDDDLDRFFHRFAGQNQYRHYVGVTYVAIDDGHVLGFVTVAAGDLEGEKLPARLQKKLPRFPLPVLRLARLAVDLRAQGKGLGRRLLRFVLELAERMVDDYGCVGVVVDAKPHASELYAKYGFVALQPLEGQSDARPQPTPMFLSMRLIKRAR